MDLACDGVFSGGGIKGLAFAGALAAAEEAGYTRWRGVAGTSAGAITAMALAVGYDAARLRGTLDAFDFAKLADYGFPIHLLGAVRDLVLHESLVRGDALTAWIRSLLEQSPTRGVTADTTFGELRELRPETTLITVGTDLAHERMVEFPADVARYRDERGEPLRPEAFPVFEAVRISAGYPYFFPPVGGMWDRATGKQGVFVDGGVTSAFPLFAFDSPQPTRPTWGFRLHGGVAGGEQPPYRGIGGPTWPKEMLEGILESAMNALDTFEQRRFASRVIAIPTGAVSTLNFALTDEEKTYLYESGFKAAAAFFAASPSAENSYGRTP